MDTSVVEASLPHSYLCSPEIIFPDCENFDMVDDYISVALNLEKNMNTKIASILRRKQGLYTVGEAADMLRMNRSTMVLHIRRGHLPGPTHLYATLPKRKHYNKEDIEHLRGLLSE